jgi:hypothetical protein
MRFWMTASVAPLVSMESAIWLSCSSITDGDGGSACERLRGRKGGERERERGRAGLAWEGSGEFRRTEGGRIRVLGFRVQITVENGTYCSGIL